jgi:hypothetical protein
MELEEIIANSCQSKDDIHNDVNAYCALKRKIDNPNSCHDNDDIWRMKDLHNVYLLGMNIRIRQKKINAACKVVSAATAAATAATTAIATSNIANTSIISSNATSVDSSASTSINPNKITASFESTPPSSDSSFYFISALLL